MTEENGTTPEQPVQGHVAINMTPQSMNIQIAPQPINLAIDEANMNQMVKEWLANHPALFDELVKQRLAQKQTELAIIRDIHSSRVN